MKGIRRIVSLILVLALIFCMGCKSRDSGAETGGSTVVGTEGNAAVDSGNTQEPVTAEPTAAPVVSTDTGSTPAGSAEEPADEGLTHIGGKEIIVYYPNWKLGEPNGNVEDIPWEYVTMVNHAFWEIIPLGDETETSFERRSEGKEARTEFGIVSSMPMADEEIFAKYKEYHELYPDVRIMISIGGWSRCGYFSEMAYTE